MKIKLYRAIHKLGEAGEEVNVTSEIGNQLLCQGRVRVISHDSPPQDAMVSKLVAPPPEEPEPVKVVVVTGDSNDAQGQDQKHNKEQPREQQGAEPKKHIQRSKKTT